MHSAKKKRNKRHRRRNVLDVKLRSDHVRALRARGLAVMMGVLFGTVFTCYLVWRSAEWALDRLIYENRTFAISRIQIHTDGQIAPAYLQALSRVRVGQNLMALDLADVKSNLELLSNIESVAVERVLPATIRIRVVEREPMTRVLFPRIADDGQWVMQGYLLASDGTVMMPLDPKYCSPEKLQPSHNLPILSGLRANEVRLGRVIDVSRAHLALAFLEAFNRSGMGARVQLERVDLTQPGVLVASTADGARVTLGVDDFNLQLARWRDIHQESLRLQKRILTLDLAVKNNVPVRWVDADEVTAGPFSG